MKKNYLKKVRSSLYIISIRRLATINNIKSSNDINNYDQFSSSTIIVRTNYNSNKD